MSAFGCGLLIQWEKFFSHTFNAVEISKAGYDTTQNDEANEEAYYEVIEYIRLGVFIIYNQYNMALNEASRTTIH